MTANSYIFYPICLISACFKSAAVLLTLLPVQSGLNLFGLFNDSIWLKYSSTEGYLRPPLSSIHHDLAARLGIPAAAPQGSPDESVEKKESWAEQFNSFSQLDSRENNPGHNLNEKTPTAGSALLDGGTVTEADPNSLFGSRQISADVQRKLSKLQRRLPPSLYKNSTLHSILSVLNHTELVAEISASQAKDWLRKKFGVSSAPTASPTLQDKLIHSLKFLVVFTIELVKYVSGSKTNLVFGPPLTPLVQGFYSVAPPL